MLAHPGADVGVWNDARRASGRHRHQRGARSCRLAGIRAGAAEAERLGAGLADVRTFGAPVDQRLAKARMGQDLAPSIATRSIRPAGPGPWRRPWRPRTAGWW